jgi:outer membrane protein assembly factor BamB
MRSEYGRPLLSGRYLYVGSSGADALFRIERENGGVVWRYPAGAPVHSEAVRIGERILFSDSAGYTWLYPLDGNEPVWKHYAGAPVLTSPVVSGTRVFVASIDNVLHALDLETGATEWRYAHPADMGRTAELELYGAAPPLVLGDQVLAAFHDGRVVALGLARGEVIWETRVGEGRYPDIVAAMASVEQQLFVGGFSGPFVSLDLESREIRWRVDVGTTSAPVVDGLTLYIASSAGRMLALDRITGALLWEWDSKTPGALTQPLRVGDGLLVASSDGDLWLVEAKTGRETWRLDPGWLIDGITAPPAVDGRELWLVTAGGTLASLAFPDRQVEQGKRFSFREPPWSRTVESR